ncbi:MAG: hypothetical protein WC058_14240 [Phycisphaeraceae bacterium]
MKGLFGFFREPFREFAAEFLKSRVLARSQTHLAGQFGEKTRAAASSLESKRLLHCHFGIVGFARLRTPQVLFFQIGPEAARVVFPSEDNGGLW